MPTHEACHLELSGLTTHTELCGGCGLPAGEHKYWSRRPRPTIPPPPPVPRAAHSCPGCDDLVAQLNITRRVLEAARAVTVDKLSTRELALVLVERGIRRVFSWL